MGPSSGSASGAESLKSEKQVGRPFHEQPAIFHKIGSDVLGQHGGELLIHFEKYGKNLKRNFRYYRPGMIVIGTEVTVTLLVCSFKHWYEIQNENSVENQMSIIYYSEPKDLLKKEDCDQLLESFARLKNVLPSSSEDLPS